MTLAPGARLGPYEVISLLGAGGMGQVYRARDPKLARDVALKILPDVFTHDPERLARFAREAQVLASLNHPNIAVIHDVQDAGGVHYLVLELVEGENLAERLARGPLPADEALDVCRQVAGALEAAHEKGILHRDLKPANIRLRPDGRVTVLDFGLAKITPGDAGDVADSPTISLAYTGQGVILGTAAYMSPEQARGRAVDKRADIWAFGCVLFETLTAAPAFRGETITDIIASVVKSEPEWARLPHETPPVVRSLLRQCLQKAPKDRLHEIADARVAIQEAQTAPAMPVTRRHERPQWQTAVLALTLVLAGAAAGWLGARGSLAPADVHHLELDVRPADQLVGSSASVRPSRTAMAISPDGRLIVFTGTATADGAAPGVSRLYARQAGESVARPIPGTEGARGPFFSPDGEWIGFWAAGRIMRVPASGGPAVPVLTLQAGPTGLSGASWSDDGAIYFSYPMPVPETGISKVSPQGGSPQAVTTRDVAAGERHVLPHVLPGGRAMLFTRIASADWEQSQVVLHRFDTGEPQLLIDGAADARYVASGHLVYLRMGTLTAVPFDLGSLRITGEHVALIEQVMQAANQPNAGDETGTGQFVVSASGTLLYTTGGVHPPRESTLVWVDPAGNETLVPSTEPRSPYMSPRVSPDRTRIAVLRAGSTTGSWDAWIFDAVRPGGQRLRSPALRNWPAIWSPDGRRIAHSSERGILVSSADGSGTPQALTDSQYRQFPASWVSTAAGELIAFVEQRPSGPQIWVGSFTGETLDARPFLDDPDFSFTFPAFSPDGRWLAYVSNESGGYAVWVRPYPGPGSPIRISPDSGVIPVWTSNGRELLLRSRGTPDGIDRFYSVEFTNLETLAFDSPKVLFETGRETYGETTPVRGWDVTADGQRLLLARGEPSREAPVTHIKVVLNWLDEVRRRVPAR